MKCSLFLIRLFLAYFHELKQHILPTLILLSKISKKNTNSFIWMASSIGEIVEKQKNDKVI